MQSLFRGIWELLLPISMPWQIVLVILPIIPVLPLLFLRCLPWLVIKLLQVVLFITELIARILCFFEYKITRSIRKKKGKLPGIIYILGDILATSVRFCQSLKVSVEHLSENLFRTPWILRSKGWYALPLIFIPVWFTRPYLGDSSLGTLIDHGVSWWCSLENWIMDGEWKPSNLSCRYPDSPPRWDTFLKAREYQLKREIQAYTKEIETRPNSSTAYYNRGNTYLNIENIEAAFKDYTTSVEVDAAYAPGYVGRGDIYFIKGDKSGAFKEYSHAVSADPEYVPSYVGRGNVYLAINDTSSAFKEYSLATSIDPQYAPGYVGRGDVYQRLGDKEAALQEYGKAVQLDPNYAFAYARIGNLYYQNFDNREAAVKEYKIAAEVFLKNNQIDRYHEISSILDELNSHTIYTVIRGDSLSKISQKHGVSIKVIVSANRETYPSLVTNPDAIEVGWRLKIPQ